MWLLFGSRQGVSCHQGFTDMQIDLFQMPTQKKSANKKAKPAKSFEETLWDTANKLRGSVDCTSLVQLPLAA